MVASKADGTPLNEVTGFDKRAARLCEAVGATMRRRAQADRINALAAERGESWLPRYGGLISSEWEFAKGLQLLEEGPGSLRCNGPLGGSSRLDRLATVR